MRRRKNRKGCIIKTIIFLISALFIINAHSHPKAIILIRHAEETNDKDDTGLSEYGYSRALQLPDLFEHHPELKKLGPPAALYAAGPKNADSSMRSIQTLQELSRRIGRPINKQFTKVETLALTKFIKKNNDDQVVVICWQHKLLGQIVENFNLKKTYDYPSGKFDQVWVITYDKKDKPFLTQFTQNIVPSGSKDAAALIPE